MEASSLDKGSLKIGDYISLKTLKYDKYLAAEGILLEDVIVHNDLANFDECLFCVHLQRQYSAARELSSFLETYSVDQGSLNDEGLSKYLEALQRGQDNENKLNDSYMTNKTGQVVLFGDTIQLFHIKSGKYLTIVPNKLASGERENISVTLSSTGNSMSWLQILPRFKIDKEGDRIPTNTEIYLKVAERDNEFVHCADRHYNQKRDREVNCSLELTSWKINIFQNSTDSIDPSTLMMSQVVYIHDPETKTCLTLAKQELENLEGDNDSLQNSMLNDEPLSVVLAPMQDTFVDSNFLWLIESLQLTQGGPILWKTEQVRLKHLNTGMYLKQTTKEIDDSDERAVCYCVSTNPMDIGTLISLNEVYSSVNHLRNAKPVQFGHNNYWVSRMPANDDRIHELRGTKDRNNAINVVINKYTEKRGAEEGGDENDAMSKEPLDIFAGGAARKYLRKYLRMTKIPTTKDVTTLWPTGERNDIDFLTVIMTKLTFFCQGFPISSTDVELGVDKANLSLRIRRQHLLREQGILEIILRLVSKLAPVSDIENTSSKLEKEEKEEMLTLGNKILSLCFNALFLSVQDHPENQMYIANFMPVLLSHLGVSQPMASKCVTEMLSNNIELQETKIGTREIAIFVDKLRAAKMGSMYLNLLQSCCSCQGNGVDNNQCKVAEMLFSDTSDVIINIHTDTSTRTPVDWGVPNVYIKGERGSESVIMGDVLLHKGLPRITLSWSDNHMDYAPQTLFGMDLVPIEKFFLVTSLAPALSSSSKSMSIRDSKDLRASRSFTSRQSAFFSLTGQKRSIGNYLIAEMNLAAEMCLDRNYVAMHLLDPLFPYETLVSMLKMDLDNNLKSAAIRLLMCLHVDRDPQATTKVPCLTRTWSEIQNNEEPKLPYVEVERREKFALIQQILSEHIHEMAGARWEEYSQHCLRMLRTLIMFNFYGTVEKLEDCIGPLIIALDRRSVDFDVYDNSSSKSAKMRGKATNTSTTLFEATVGHSTAENSYEDSAAIFDATNNNNGNMMITSEEDDKDSNKESMWQFRLLTFLESIPVLIAVLGLVFVAVGLTVYQSIVAVDDSSGSWLYILGLTITMVFIVEVTVRAYCYLVVHHELLSFVKNGFNQIDMFVITLDVIFLCLPAGAGAGASYTKILRLIRLLRLLRVLRAARVVSKLADLNGNQSEEWKPPIRYTKAPSYELETMVEAVTVLSYCQKVIEDRNVSIFLRWFSAWESGKDTRNPSDIFRQVVQETQSLSLNIGDFDNIMIDVIMFVHAPLVQGTLELIMAHHSVRRTLLNNAKEIQLLVSHKREKQYKLVDQMLQQLERNAETHELWGELESEADQETNRQTKDILQQLIHICRIRRSVLEFDEEFMPDVDMQNLYRNLGCFSICMKVLGLLDSVEEDENGELDEVALNTKELCKMCNELLYWFLVGNAKNQVLGFEELQLFLDTLDSGIKSHRIIRAIFKDNEQLMKLLPHTHLADLTEKICKEGKRHTYLTLFASISFVGDKNIPENQLQIMISLTSPGQLAKVSSFLVPVTHPDYQRKQELMEPYLNARNVDIDDLPEELAYHLTLLEVFSGCTVGRLNITTVEAKVQSIFNYIDIIHAILDPATMLYARLKLATHLLNAVIEVEMKIPGLEQSAAIWDLLKSFAPVFQFAKDDIRAVEKLGWESEEINRQKIEYMLICINIVGSFFEFYYDPLALKHDDGTASADRASITPNQVNQLVYSYFHAIKDVYDMDSPKLSKKHKTLIYNAMVSLNNSATTVIVTSLDATHHVDHEEIENAEDISQEAVVLRKYNEFLAALDGDAELQAEANNESLEFIHIIESLPYLSDPTPADVRYETFIKKLVAHVRDNFKIVNNERRLDPRCSQTTIWIIKAFRTMIENRMGMSIYERDDEGGEEQDIAAGPVVNALNSCGATNLCLDLIAVGIDEELQTEAIKLCVAMLFKEGGAIEVQETIYNYLSKNPTDLFFKQCRLTLQKLISWHKWNGIIELPEDKDPELPEDCIIVRFLQLMCEGHYLNNQEIMREQPWNHTTVNLLDDFVMYLNALSRIPCRTSTAAAIRVAATILEVIQGPCAGNQVHLALNTEVIETLNRILRAKELRDCVHDEEIELKGVGVDIFQGLLEGQGLKSVVYERVLSVIHLDVIQVMSKPPEPEKIVSPEGEITFKEVEVNENEEVLQTQAMVLLQMFCDFRPSLHEELGISRNVEDIVSTGTACIEVFWRGELHRRFFHVPRICADLAKTTKDRFVEEVDRSNLENKLLNLLASAHDMYREVKHQQVLKEKKLSVVFSPKNQDRVTWASFFISLLINTLFLAFYDASSGEPTIDPDKTRVIDGLNICQTFFASFTLLQYIVVKIPVVFQSAVAKGLGFYESIFYTATDGLLVYYFLYLVCSLLGIFVADYFLTFLLLDIIVKNSTTRDVLNAVIFPRKQLGMTLVLGVFLLYIYAYYLFFYFREDILNDRCSDLWGCVKFVFCYGLRQGGGVGDILPMTVGDRWLIDTTFFIFVTIMLLNIIFGIIIDTFSSLRSNKLERLADTTDICFVCGIDNLTFDRASKEPDGFIRHIKLDHNMWNYLFFIFHLWEQDKDDDDGLELYVRRAIENNEIYWFPMNKAMCLTMGATDLEIIRDDMLKEIEASEDRIESEVANIRMEVKYSLDQVAKALKQDFGKGNVKSGIVNFLRNLQNQGPPELARKDSFLEDNIKDDASAAPSEDLKALLGKNISIGIISITGLSEEERNGISCRMISDSAIYSLTATEVDDEEVLFDSTQMRVVIENAHVHDTRNCQIQILHSSSVERVGKFIGGIEVKADELMASDEHEMEKAILAQDGSESGAIIKFLVTCKEAKGFGSTSEVGSEDLSDED